MTSQNYPAMTVTGLYKKFGDNIAVNNLNLTVPRGSIFGIVGPNGAGKTTMLNMATGLLRPDAGHATICGFDMWNDPIPAKAAMGLLADGLPVFDRLTGDEYLQYLGALRGIPEAELAPRITELLHALGLEEATDKYIADYSAGMTKKILLAGALIHNPNVLILDEPLEAVDPVSGRIIQQILRAFAASGGTVILSSHVMELVEGLCDQVAIIHHGTVRLEGNVKELAAHTSLTDLFVSIVGGGELSEGQLAWLQHNQPEQPVEQPHPGNQPAQSGSFDRPTPATPTPHDHPQGEPDLPDDLGTRPTEQFDVSALRSVEPPRTDPPYSPRPLRTDPTTVETPEPYPQTTQPSPTGPQPGQSGQPGQLGQSRQPGQPEQSGRRTVPTPPGYPYTSTPDPQPNNPRQNYPNPPQYGQQQYSPNPPNPPSQQPGGQPYANQPYSGNPYTDQFQRIDSYPPGPNTSEQTPPQPYLGHHRQPLQNPPEPTSSPEQPEQSPQPQDNQPTQEPPRPNPQQSRFSDPYSNGPETWR